MKNNKFVRIIRNNNEMNLVVFNARLDYRENYEKEVILA